MQVPDIADECSAPLSKWEGECHCMFLFLKPHKHWPLGKYWCLWMRSCISIPSYLQHLLQGNTAKCSAWSRWDHEQYWKLICLMMDFGSHCVGQATKSEVWKLLTIALPKPLCKSGPLFPSNQMGVPTLPLSSSYIYLDWESLWKGLTFPPIPL